MRLTASGVVRWSIALLLGLLALWCLPRGGQLTFAGLVLTATVVVGYLVKPGRIAWYAVGAGLVLACLVLGVKDGPFDPSLTGYCNSVFEPGFAVVDDAPEGTYERCQETRQQRIPLVAGLGLSGLVSLTMSVRAQRRNQAPAVSAVA
ncbi:hypothetical protein [Nocardioides taihuensis]|uniref:Uncharacterized protein n=1 Tax=Nocardioides taihuensis TaxID=1835606 RepID=A0ABW0BM84_9ACTN